MNLRRFCPRINRGPEVVHRKFIPTSITAGAAGESHLPSDYANMII